MTQVFISYSRKDREFVQRLVADLSKRIDPPVEIFYDMLIEPGASWADTLAEQIERADIVLAVLSPDYLESPWAQQELNVAFSRQLEKRARLLPLLVRPCTPTGFLSQLTWVDFTEDYDAGLVRLVWGITGNRPMAAKGEQPGALNKTVDPSEVERLRREVGVAVGSFRSKTGGLGGSKQVVQDVQPVAPRADSKKECFIVMPFGDQDLQVVYEDFVKPTLESGCNLRCERGDDVFGSHIIMNDILKSISAADVVLADLTHKNANVFYEVGICHAIKKPVLLLAQSMDDVPFDLRHRRVLLYEYTPRGCKRLESLLAQHMNAVLSETCGPNTMAG